MKRHFTYKEYTLIAGILVAIIIVFTLWFNQEPVKEPSHSMKRKSMTIQEAAKSLVRRAVAEIRF